MIEARSQKKESKGNRGDDESDAEANEMINAMKVGLGVYVKQIQKEGNLLEQVRARKKTLE